MVKVDTTDTVIKFVSKKVRERTYRLTTICIVKQKETEKKKGRVTRDSRVNCHTKKVDGSNFVVSKNTLGLQRIHLRESTKITPLRWDQSESKV